MIRGLHMSLILLNFGNPIITINKKAADMKKTLIPLALIITGPLCATAAEALATPADGIDITVDI